MAKAVLLCAPTYFDIEYEINPWMHKDNRVDAKLAYKQWELLYTLYSQQFAWNVQLIDPVAGLPDMVFTANGALVIDNRVALPTFRAPDRQAETAHFKTWFESKGYKEFLQPKYDFEGEGDALLWNDVIFAGYPWRSDHASHAELASFFNKTVVSLQLTDDRFYHLDTCLTPIDAQTVAIWPDAFTKESIRKINELAPKVIMANPNDALAYGLNAVVDGDTIVLSDQATHLIEVYQGMNKKCIPVPISEFKKSGGGVKCLTLELR